MKYEDNPTVVSAKPTGHKKQVGSYLCEDYFFESDNAQPDHYVYVSLDYP